MDGSGRATGRCGAFTLVETLVACAVAALAVTAAAAILAVAVRGFTRAAGEIRTGRLRAALAGRLRGDVRSIYSVMGRPELAFRIVPRTEDPGQTAEAVWCRLQPSRSPRRGQHAELRRIAYASDTLDGRSAGLLRIEWPVLDEPRGEDVPWDVLLEKLEAFSVEALGSDGRWTNRWDSVEQQGLPRGLRVRIEAPGLGPHPVEVTEAIPSVAGSNGAAGSVP
jgi:hypothetical protein